MTLKEQEKLLTQTCNLCNKKKLKLATTLETRSTMYHFMFILVIALLINWHDQSILNCLLMFCVPFVPFLLITFLANHSTVYVFRDANDNLHFHTTEPVYLNKKYHYYENTERKDLEIKSIILKVRVFGPFCKISVKNSSKTNGIKIRLSGRSDTCFLLKTAKFNKPIIYIYNLHELLDFLQLLTTRKELLDHLVYNYIEASEISADLYDAIIKILVKMEIMKDTMGRSKHAQAIRKMLEEALSHVVSSNELEYDKKKVTEQLSSSPQTKKVANSN